MKKRAGTKNDLLWSLSLMTVGISTLLLIGSKLIGIALPDIITRLLGGVGLVMLPALVYLTATKLRQGKKE